MSAMEAIQTVERLPSMRQGQEGLAALALVREELALVEQKMRSLGDVGFAPLAEEWESLCTTLGRNIEVALGPRRVRGRAEALDADGALLLRTEHGHLERITGGDVTVLS